MEIKAADLFHTWKTLSPEATWQVIYFKEKINTLINAGAHTQIGYYIKALLKSVTAPKKKKLLKKINPEQLVDIYHDEGMIWNTPFYHFPVKQIKIKNTILAAPDEDLALTSFYHFNYIDAAYSMIGILQHHYKGTEEQATEIDQAIDKFICTLYLPHNGRSTVPFDRQMVEYYQPFLKLFGWQKAIILRAYSHIRAKIFDRYPHLFPVPTAKNENIKEEPVFTGPMWRELLFDVAKSSVFTGYDKAAHSNLYDVLDYLELEASKRINQTNNQ